SDGAHAANRARNVHGGQSIFYDFVGNISEAGFLDRGARERFHVVRSGLRAGFDHGVHLFLGKCGEFFLGGGGAGHQFAGFLNGDEVAVAQAQNALPSPTNAMPVPLAGRALQAYFFAPGAAPPPGKIFSTCSCGRGMTCTDTSSPTRRAAAAPASVAAFTAPTSPRTITVT